MKLADFGLCKSVQQAAFPLGAAGTDEDPSANSADAALGQMEEGQSAFVVGSPNAGKMAAERIQMWQKSRRKLAFSTVGTPDYIAPEVLLKKGCVRRRNPLSHSLPSRPFSHPRRAQKAGKRRLILALVSMLVLCFGVSGTDWKRIGGRWGRSCTR